MSIALRLSSLPFLGWAELIQHLSRLEVSFKSVTDNLVVYLAYLGNLFGPDLITRKRSRMNTEHLNYGASEL